MIVFDQCGTRDVPPAASTAQRCSRNAQVSRFMFSYARHRTEDTEFGIISVHSTRMALHGNLAAVLLRLGDPDNTVRECTRALELADAHPDT